MCDDTPYTLHHNDCPFSSQEFIVLVKIILRITFSKKNSLPFCY